MKKIIDFFLSRPFCLILLFVAFGFGLALPWIMAFHFGGVDPNPLGEYGTLSILCEDHKGFFWAWAILIGGAYLLNTNFAYRKYGEKSRFLRVLTVITFVALCLVALTLKHPVDTFVNNPKRIIHWIATGAYIVCVGLSIFLFLAKNRKVYKGFAALSVIVVLVALSIAVWLLTLGKSAMMEAIPNAVMQIILAVLNFTDVFEPKRIANNQ